MKQQPEKRTHLTSTRIRSTGSMTVAAGSFCPVGRERSPLCVPWRIVLSLSFSCCLSVRDDGRNWADRAVVKVPPRGDTSTAYQGGATTPTQGTREEHTACTSTSFEMWRSKCQLVKAVSSNTQKEISLMSQGSIQISEYKTVIRPDMILHLKPWRSCFHRAAAVVFAQVHKLELSRVLHTGFMPPCRPRRGNTQHSLTSTSA